MGFDSKVQLGPCQGSALPLWPHPKGSIPQETAWNTQGDPEGEWPAGTAPLGDNPGMGESRSGRIPSGLALG